MNGRLPDQKAKLGLAGMMNIRTTISMADVASAILDKRKGHVRAASSRVSIFKNRTRLVAMAYSYAATSSESGSLNSDAAKKPV